MGDRIKRRIAILGSTGSIGQQTLEVARNLADRFEVVGLGAGKNVSLLSSQVEEFHPKLVSFQAGEGLSELPHGNYRLIPMEEIASHPEVELVVVATSGKAGLIPTLAALRAGKPIALANKEVLVMAGEIIMAEAKRHKIQILPLDSEHSAIWQCLQGEERGKVSRLLLTASGGPFWHYSLEQLAAVTPEEALKHPTWRMGKKVTIDSATLMNKGMEVIEAHWLFDIPFDHIDVMIHPTSVVHSLVEFVDGSVKAQLSPPDMRLPIQYALSYPERVSNWQLPKIDWSKFVSLSFERPEPGRFPCLEIAIEAGRKGGTYPAVLCAADEVAVELFLSGYIGFLEIAEVVREALEKHQPTNHPTLEEILAADQWTREYAKNWRPS